VTYFGHWLGLSRETKLKQDEIDRHARYLAIRMVCILEPFVMRCCDVVNDDGLYHEGERHFEVMEPTLAFPEDVDWKSTEPDLAFRMLGLPNELASADKAISFAGEMISGPPDYDEVFEERAYQYARIGLAAIDIAARLSSIAGLPPKDYSRWNPRKLLEDAFIEEDKRRKLASENFERTIAKHERIGRP
jgi:hypothetical protein